MGLKIDPARLDEVAEHLADGRSSGWIQAKCTPAWGVSPRMVRRYIEKVRRRWESETESRDEVKARLREALWTCFRLAKAKGHIRAAVEALGRVMILEGIAAPEKVEHSGQSPPFWFKTVEQARARIVELSLKHGFKVPAGYLKEKS